jgi:sec-independent protein translocase protein TatA
MPQDLCDNGQCSSASSARQILQGEIQMGELFSGPHLLFLGVIVIVLFGGKKLPELGKGLGEGLRGFKEGMKGIGDDDAEKKEAEAKARADAEAKAYQEAKLAAEAKAAAEARLAAEQKAREGEVVIK